MNLFLDRVQLYHAVSSQAVPALEAIAANGHLRELGRFDRDDPPPYASSTESEDLDNYDTDPMPHVRGGPMPAELMAVMERPIDDIEVNSISRALHAVARPHRVYHAEATREYERVDGHRCGPRPMMFRGRDGARRKGVIARHNVKRRWQKLGVWNGEWGFAGRKVRPADDFHKWTWRWQPRGAADDPIRATVDARELVARALRLRQNLSRGECVPVVPRSRLGQESTAAEAEAFLISRPWFLFQIEAAEELARYHRLSAEDRERFPHSARRQVTRWWRERGDWRDEYNETGRVTAWKWRHESPSPEPEDLTPVERIRRSPLEAAEDLGLSESERDELETIELPESEQPDGYWMIEEGDPLPSFPGQMINSVAEARESEVARAERLQRSRAEGREPPPVDPGVNFFLKNFFPDGTPSRLFDTPRSVAHPEDPSSPAEHEALAYSRPLRQRYSRHRTASRHRDLPPLSPPPLRRSARIAAMAARKERLAEKPPPPPATAAAAAAAAAATAATAAAAKNGARKRRRNRIYAQATRATSTSV